MDPPDKAPVAWVRLIPTASTEKEAASWSRQSCPQPRTPPRRQHAPERTTVNEQEGPPRSEEMGVHRRENDGDSVSSSEDRKHITLQKDSRLPGFTWGFI